MHYREILKITILPFALFDSPQNGQFNDPWKMLSMTLHFQATQDPYLLYFLCIYKYIYICISW